MKAWLMYPDRDFDPEAGTPWNSGDLIQDLGLPVLFDAMAGDDAFVRAVAETALLTSLTDTEVIRYRQQMIQDCLDNAEIVTELHALAVDAIDRERKCIHLSLNRSTNVLRRAVEALELLVARLRDLRRIASRRGGNFRASGFVRFFDMLQKELDDDYFSTIDHHLDELKFRYGVLASKRLVPCDQGCGFVLRYLSRHRRGRLTRLVSRQPESYSFEVDPHDERASHALAELKDRVLEPAADAASQAAAHILSFFNQLRAELAFYVGTLNLHRALAAADTPVCFPEPDPSGRQRHACRNLQDVCLCLAMDEPVVGNSLDAEDTRLVFITGANQGGKSTFLRSIGLAQLMLQAGLFVTAESFAANLCNGVFTHYKRAEDTTMAAGKFEEELGRMSEIVDHIGPDALVLLNESFAATSEREGSAIAAQVVDAFVAGQIQVFYVTHLYELARNFHEREASGALFLRAERTADTRRTFRLVKAEPLPVGHGRDLYERIFEDDRGAANSD